MKVYRQNENDRDEISPPEDEKMMSFCFCFFFLVEACLSGLEGEGSCSNDSETTKLFKFVVGRKCFFCAASD